MVCRTWSRSLGFGVTVRREESVGGGDPEPGTDLLDRGGVAILPDRSDQKVEDLFGSILLISGEKDSLFMGYENGILSARHPWACLPDRLHRCALHREKPAHAGF